ncbi:hypothetical protein [Thalassospira sp. TSL5-1]|uniref:hypothetical protein n=1 Tax=Thalassospira sp. TSL5-1 TaxID=1544451 RepID=UPI000AF77604|nr:hypothetical protein [Thalassospira sp. TSL5-1]
MLAQTTTYKPMNFGAEDGTEPVLENHSEYGLAEQADLPRSALTIDTGAQPQIQSAADEAWALEQEIVGMLWDFETRMTDIFGPYAEAWERDGWSGVPESYVSGFGKGVEAWWEGETDFWGSAWGALKSTTSLVGGYVYDGATNGPAPKYIPNAPVVNLAFNVGSDIVDGLKGLFAGVDIMDYIEPLHSLLRAFLFGDIDAIIAAFKKLTVLKELPGAIGEFGQMIADVIKTGIDTMRDMVELIRRTPLLGLISSTFMRVVTMMTPNFWAEMAGQGHGFIIPELIIWAVTAIIAALSAGAGASALTVRAANIASKIRGAIKGGSAAGKIVSFMGDLWKIVQKIKDMGVKLRRSIFESIKGEVDGAIKRYRQARYFSKKLKELQHHGPGAHGVQRHEGQVRKKQLDRRCLEGKDPITGTTTDGVHGGTHGYGKDATKIKTPADFVRAYEKALENSKIKSQMEAGKDEIRAEIPIKELLGENWRSRIFGRTRTGSRKKPGKAKNTVFPDETNMFVYLKKKDDGAHYLYTMYPKIPEVSPK